MTGEHDEPEHRHVTIGFVHFGATDDVFEQLGAEELASRLAQLTRLVEEQAARYDICCANVAGGGGKFILTAGAPDAGADGEGRMLRTVLAILDAEPPLPYAPASTPARCSRARSVHRVDARTRSWAMR